MGFSLSGPATILTTTKDKTSRTCESLNTRSLDTWLFEIMAAIFSVACFASMCGVLIAYDNKPRPDLRYGLTLNAVISILATGCKSSLLFTIGESISQAKWSWFCVGAPKPLLHMQTFDSASRGPFGSIMMLFHKRISPASFGAVVIILFLAFDPFLQQIVKYPTRLASTSAANAVAKRLMFFGPLVSTAEWDIAYGSGLWSEENIFHPACPSGNCVWPQFKSVGTCSQCADIMASASLDCHRLPQDDKTHLSNEDSQDHTKSFNESCQINLPMGHSAKFTVQSHIEEITNSNSSSSIVFPQHLTWGVHGFEAHLPQYADNLTFAGIVNPLMVLASANIEYNSTRILSGNPSEGLKITNITECSLALCLADYDVSVSQGIVETNVSGVDFGHSFSQNVTFTMSTTTPENATFLSACWRPTNGSQNASFEIPTQSSRNSQLGRHALKTVAAILSSSEFEFCGMEFVLPSLYSLEGSDSAVHLYYGSGEWEEYGLSRGWNTVKDLYAVDSPPQRIASVGLEAIMSNISSSLNKMALRANGEDVKGTAYSIQVLVEVQWPWLILPGLLLLFGVCFFVLTIFSSKKHSIPLWKSSVLALIYHGLNGDVVDSSDHSTASKMESRAEITSVKLQMSDEKKTLMLKQGKALPSQVEER